MTPEARQDFDIIVALAREVANGSTRYVPGLEKAFARTIVHMKDHWQPKEKTIKHVHSDAEVRIKP